MFLLITLVLYLITTKANCELPPRTEIHFDLAEIQPGIQQRNESSLQQKASNPIPYTEIPCGIRNGAEYNRIVGGSTTEKGEFPWQVSIQIVTPTKVSHTCGGAIVASKWVITAAHCVAAVPKPRLRIVAGDYKLFELEGTEQFRRVSRVIIDSFNLEGFIHDLALLELESPLDFDSALVAPICIPTSDDEFFNKGIVTGWGKLSEQGVVSNILRKVELPLIDPGFCKRLYNRNGLAHYFNGCQYCAGLWRGGKDSCQGDSGGPMACKNEDNNRYYLCGVVSWGIGCGRKSYPGIYTKVPCYSNWISRIINNINNIVDTYQ